jgi:hypothetical protein
MGLFDALSGLLGLGGQEVGQNPVTQQQIQQSYGGTQSALQQQQALLQALQAQQGGVAGQGQVYGQLQDVIAGRGPNPAQAMLAQATGQNVANQAALMASQRGAQANPALLAQQMAQAGSNAQQQAAGQAATLQAQQALGALGQAGNLASTQAAQRIGATQGLTADQLAQQQLLANQYQSANQLASQNQRSVVGGLLGGLSGIPALSSLSGAAGPIAGMAAAAHGGEIPKQPAYHAWAGAMLGKKSVGSRLKAGGSVPGQAAVKGDNLKNDTVHAMLSPGEVVIPRSVMQGKDPARGAAEFVQAVLAKKGARK